MKRLNYLPIILLVLGSMLLLTQCDLIIGSGDKPNVSIDLSGFYGDTRGIGMPAGTLMTGIRVTVFGPGMERIVKMVSAGARYINMYVPAGRNRYFTLEIFFTITNPQFYSFMHVRSFKGRAEADLRPGYFVGIKFHMTAGATTLLIPDQNNPAQKIFEAENISFSPYSSDTFGGIPSPSDLDIDSYGRIVVGNNGRSGGFAIGASIGGSTRYHTIYADVSAIAMDRDSRFDINRSQDGIIETEILYFESSDSLFYAILDNNDPAVPHPIDPASVSPVQLDDCGLDTITGMHVDPWTHHLYIVGQTGNQSAIVEYDPFFADPQTQTYGLIIRTTISPVSGVFQDVITKEDQVFVLNNVQPDETTVPIVLEFNKTLQYQGGFGTISSVQVGPRWEISASTDPGKFYNPKRFFAHERDGLYIMDDSQQWDGNNEEYDKLVYINTDLAPSSWETFPATQVDQQPTGEPFIFFEP